MDLLTERTRLVHIGAHSVDIEASLRERSGRTVRFASPTILCKAERETPLGRIVFGQKRKLG